MKKIDKKNIEDIFALSPMQEGMLFHYLKDNESDYYFVQLCLTITGEIDLNCFQQAWDFVVETNEMLRAVFRWERVKNPVQMVLKEHRLEPKYYDFSNKSTDEKQELLEEIKTRDGEEKFDLRSVPFRVTLCKIDKNKYEMLVSNHHILYDGWSNGIILREFLQNYHDLCDQKTPVRPVKNKFKEHIKWLQKQDAVKQEEYRGAHLCSTVRFSDGLKELLKQENAIFIEIGPGRILGMMVRVHPGKKPGQMVLNTVKHPQENASDDYFLLDKVGQLWQHGQTIDWAGFYGEEKRCRVPLPTYPFEGKRYWIDEKALKIGNGLPLFSRTSETVQTKQDIISPTGVSESLTVINGLQTGDEAAPRSQLEAVIVRMWKELMGLDNVGIYDDFFQLNGSSLVATQIIARLMQEYKVEIPMTRFYEQPTIASLAEVVNELRKS